jgi:hypothetical protein
MALFRANDRLPLGAVIILHRLFVSLIFLLLILSPPRSFSPLRQGVFSQTFISREPHVSLCCPIAISLSCTYVTANCTVPLTALAFPVPKSKAKKAKSKLQRRMGMCHTCGQGPQRTVGPTTAQFLDCLILKHRILREFY